MRNWNLLASPGSDIPGLRDYGHWRNMRRRLDGGIDVELTAGRSPTGVQSTVQVGELVLADMLSIAAVVIAPPGMLVQARVVLVPFNNRSQFFILGATSVLGNGGPQEVYMSGPVRGDASPFAGYAGGFLYVASPPEGSVLSITGWQLALNEIAVGPMTLPTIEAPVVAEPPIAGSVELGGLAATEAPPARKGGADLLWLLGAAALALGGRKRK